MSPQFENDLKSKVVGLTYDDPRSGINRQQIVKSLIRPGAKLEARLEPDNEFDPNAVALWFVKRSWFSRTEYHLGYMTKTINERMAELLRQGKAIDVVVIEVSGGSKSEPSLGVNIKVSY